MSAYAYRRGSIFWALTLIGVGFLFLYQNFNPEVHPWRIIGKFWPILIIFWGVSKLIDHLLARAHPERVPPPLFSGSEVILLVMILILGTVVSRIVLHDWHRWPSDMGIDINDDEWANMFMNTYTYTETGSWPVKPQPFLIIEDQHGDLEIRGTDQAAVDVVAKKVIRAENEAGGRKLSDQLKVDVVEEAGHYLLRSNRRSLPNGGRQVRTDLVVRVPKGTSTQITSERGDVLLDGLRGDQTITAQHGDVHVASVEGLVRVHKSGGSTDVHDVKGSVEVDGRSQDIDVSRVTGTVTANGDFPGSVEFQDVKQTLRRQLFVGDGAAPPKIAAYDGRGDLRAWLRVTSVRAALKLLRKGSLDASGVDGPFEMSTKGKDIQLNGFRHAVKISDTNGDINLSAAAPPMHPIEIDSKKGGIELTLPANSSFQIEATSRNGEIESDFSAPGLKLTKEGDTPSLSGSYGKGGPTIRLLTAYGTIHVIRQGPHPPTPPSPPGKPAAPAEGADETLNRTGSIGLEPAS